VISSVAEYHHPSVGHLATYQGV